MNDVAIIGVGAPVAEVLGRHLGQCLLRDAVVVQVAVGLHALNPNAFRRKPIPEEEILNSAMPMS